VLTPDGTDVVDRKLAAASAHIRALEAERDRWRERYERARDERNEAFGMLGALSIVLRLGLVLARAITNPRVGIPHLARAVWRRIPAPARRPASRIVGGLRRRLARPGPVPQPSPDSRAEVQRLAAAPVPPFRRRSTSTYLAFGYDIDQLRRLSRLAAQAASVTGDPSVLIITDCVDFSMLRDTGLLLEYVPDRATWAKHRGDADWESFRSQRVSQVTVAHHSVRTIVAPPGTISDLPGLLALLAA